MPRQSLPCPHCAKPIALGFWNLRPGRSAVDGFCRACLKPYRFGAALRRIAFGVYLANSAIAIAAYFGLQQCSACATVADSTSTALAFVLLIAALGGAGLLATVGRWLYLRRRMRSRATGDLLEPLADEDIPFSAANMPSHPAAAMSAALLLLILLGWAVVADLQGAGRPVPMRLPTDSPAAAVATTVPGSWPFVVLDVALAILVIVCAVALVRRIIRNRTRNAPGRQF